jgi:polygalacturonase
VFHQGASRRNFIRTGTAVGAALAGSLTGGAKGTPAELSRSGGMHVFNVREFGAKGDGATLDTSAINRAIDAAASAGGGSVLFPAGSYLSYSIHLKSHVTLMLANGSAILGADTPEGGGAHAFDQAEPDEKWDKYQDYGHSHFHNSLIWGEDLHDIGITGPGLIWGKGLSRGEGPGPVAEKPGVANKAIALKNCHNVLLRDFSILHGGMFGILATGVDNLTIDNLMIDTQRDGMDIDCCRNVRISHCSVNSPWDDAICLKSSFALGPGRSTEMVTISDCYVTGMYEEGSLIDGSYRRFPDNAEVDRNGRIKLGTESNGGFKNIGISNCVFDGCLGLAIISVDGAIVEDISVSNIAMRDIVGAPIFIRLGSRMRAPEGTPVGAIRRISITNIVCSEAKSHGSQWTEFAPSVSASLGSATVACSVITGVPGHAIEDVQINNMVIRHPGGGMEHDAAIELPEKEAEYPEPTMFGTTPAHGFFIRHVKGIELTQVKLQTSVADLRPAFVLNDVEDADFALVKLPQLTNVAAIALQDVRNFSLLHSRPLADTWIEKAEKRDIGLAGT